MNKIEELISELCPDGVEFRNLSEIAAIDIGEFVRQDRQGDDKSYPVFNGGRSFTGKYDDFNRDGEYILISARGANAGFVNYFSGKYWAGNSCYSINVNRDIIEAKFAYYFLKSLEQNLMDQQQKGGIPAISKTQVSDLKIPIPPMEIQSRIIRILDQFTDKNTELISILQTEADLRRKQFQFYRDHLLTFDSDIEIKTIEEVCKKISSGGTPSTRNIDYWNGNIPWLRTQEVDFCEITDTDLKITKEGLKNSSAKWIPENCVIIAMYGATVGKVAINKIPLTTNQACCNLEINEQIADYKFIFYCLENQYEYIKSLGQGTQTNINAQIVKNLQIPIPPIEEQKKIAAILDKFDKICNDLTSGIPAEIIARKKQYQYYRDKLLTFTQK